MVNTKLKFEGKEALVRSPHAHEKSPQQPEPYVVGEKLKLAVNLAIALRRPLLLEGDPGCGKTCLASAVAFELGLPFFRWNVQSISKAQDGQYVYDALGRLHDVQLKNSGAETRRDPSNPSEYCEMGALGKAFGIQDCTSVVLIDEIDKAELDFPNDLLTVLDQPWEFEVRETGEAVKANPEHVPIVFITSNNEKKNLPDAFLRRCLYHYVEFPNSSGVLKEIVERHSRIVREVLPEMDLQDAAIDRFLEIRQSGNLVKKPGTSEFLDWLKALQTFTESPFSADKLREDRSVYQLPYPELLLKLRKDWRQQFETAG